MADPKRAREKAASALARLDVGSKAGQAVGLPADQAEALLDYVRALEENLPSVGRSSDLEVPCAGCDGKGCDECDGAGTTPTDAGRKVLDLVERHLIREG